MDFRAQGVAKLMAREFAVGAAVVTFIIATPLISYGLALAGEPQSVWLWRDVFGVGLN